MNSWLFPHSHSTTMWMYLCIIISTHLQSLGLLNSFFSTTIAFIYQIWIPETQQQQHKVNRPSFSILMQCQDEYYLKYGNSQCCRCFSCLVLMTTTTLTAYVDVWVNLLLIYFQLFCAVYTTHSVGKIRGEMRRYLCACACVWVLAGKRWQYADYSYCLAHNAHIQLQLSQTKAWTGPNEALNDLSIVCGFNTNE